MTMIVFGTGGMFFNYRVAGVALRDNQVLLQYQTGMDHWCLPGGRVELGETSQTALHREMREEASESVEIERLLWVAESFFQSGTEQCHELAFYYLMHFASDSPIARASEALQLREGDKYITFQWHELAELERITLYPPFLVQGLLQLPTQTAHILDRQES